MFELKKYTVFIVTLLLGVLLTVVSISLYYWQAIDSARGRWQQSQEQLLYQFQTQLLLTQSDLHLIQAAFIAQNQLSPEQFSQLQLQSQARQISAGVLAMGFVRPVSADFLSQYIEQNRSDTRFATEFYSVFDVASSQQKEALQIVDMLSPLNSTTAQWLGFNLAHDAALKRAFERAKVSGQPWMSDGFTASLVRTESLVFYLPIYRTVLSRPTPALRSSHYLGSAMVLLQIQPFFAELNRLADSAGLAFRVVDLGAIDAVNRAETASKIRYTSPQFASDASAPMARAPVNVLGRQWRFEFQAITSALSMRQMQLMACGAILGLVFSLLLASLLQRRHRLPAVDDNVDKPSLHLTQVQQMRALLEAVSDPLILRDARGQITYANAVAELRLAEHDRCLLGAVEPVFDAAELGRLSMPLQLMVSHLDRDAQVRQYELMLKPLRDDRLQWMGTVMQARDISASSATIKSLREQVERLNMLVDIANDWFWEQDQEGRFTAVSGDLFTDLDLNPALFIGKCRWELGPGGLSAAQWAAHRAVLASQQAYRDFEYQAELNQQLLFLSVSGQPIFDHNGQFMAYRGVGRNVTAIRLAQAALLSEQQRAQATLASISDAVVSTDLNGRIYYLNSVASALLGWDPEMAQGQYLSSVYQTIDAKTRLPLAGLAALALQNSAQCLGARRSILLNKLGLHFYIEESAARIRDDAHATLGAVLVFRDMSHWQDEADRVCVFPD
ncbi:CHASE domain-containing protein [uncultured Deefgea sp.]|uniref:CHASE domain-containing protein n=1 Tax=uncultured Deefgea sp. TaxID=1304914 RepID=UPI002639CFF6|nr:CHASE domain-containing protein [uncultured Deefgea sp.]